MSDTDAAKDSTRKGAWIRLIAFSVLAVGLVAFSWLVALPSIQLCGFKVLTGRGCPGCGMTRAVTSLCRGEVLTSLRFHPLGLPMAIALLAAIIGAFQGVRGREDRFWTFMDRRGPQGALGFALALVVVWIVRVFIVPSWAADPVLPSVLFGAPR